MATGVSKRDVREHATKGGNKRECPMCALCVRSVCAMCALCVHYVCTMYARCMHDVRRSARILCALIVGAHSRRS